MRKSLWLIGLLALSGCGRGINTHKALPNGITNVPGTVVWTNSYFTAITSAAATQTDALINSSLSTMTPSDLDVQELIIQAMEDLGERLSMQTNLIEVLEVQPVTWSDASLGCPQPGMAYAQILTPGYRLILYADGDRFEYHTNSNQKVFLCEAHELYVDPEPLMPIAPKDKQPKQKTTPSP